MSYGLQTYDKYGNVLVDISTQMTRLLGQVYVPAYASGNQNFPGFSTSNESGVAWGQVIYDPIEYLFWYNYGIALPKAPVVTNTGSRVYWQGGNMNSYVYVLMWGPG